MAGEPLFDEGDLSSRFKIKRVAPSKVIERGITFVVGDDEHTFEAAREFAFEQFKKLDDACAALDPQPKQ